MSQELFVINGGHLASRGGEEIWDFGYQSSPPEAWATLSRDHKASGDAPDIFLEDKVFLWEPLKALNGGEMPAFNWQLSGSCVSGGAQNALFVRIGLEIAKLRQAERFIQPFTLLAYGQSRFMAYRDDTEGEGSSGAVMAQAMKDIGTLPIDDPELPKPHFCGPALVYDRTVELKFSSIRNHPKELVERCKKHTVDYVNVRNSDEALKELRRGRPLTWAGSWGGVMSCTYAGNPKILVNRQAGRWQHQQSCIGAWLHPTLGLQFYILNQWYGVGKDMQVDYIRTRDGRQINKILKAGTAYSVHGDVTVGEPPGGYWVSAKDMDYQCRTGEVRALAEIQGYGGDIGLIGV